MVIWRQALKRINNIRGPLSRKFLAAINGAKRAPGVVWSKISYWSDAMSVASQKRLITFFNKLRRQRQTTIDEYFRPYPDID